MVVGEKRQEALSRNDWEMLEPSFWFKNARTGRRGYIQVRTMHGGSRYQRERVHGEYNLITILFGLVYFFLVDRSKLLSTLSSSEVFFWHIN